MDRSIEASYFSWLRPFNFFFLTLGGKPISIVGTFEFIRGMMRVCLQSAVGNEYEGWSHLSMSKPSDTEIQDLEFALLGFGHAVV